jgi:tetratricopeptide (TPR) repeat protein
MVHVARGHLAEAETVLRQGAAVQDRQIGRGDRYPALGLHWLLGSVRLAQGDVAEALREFERERQLAEPHRLYGREYETSSLCGRGASLLEIGSTEEAAECFQRALSISPAHAQSGLGLSVSLRAMGSHDAADVARRRVQAALDTLTVTRPIEAALVRAQMLVIDKAPEEANAVLCKALDLAPPGFAAWTLPIEPHLLQLVGTTSFTPALTALSERAR